MRKLLQVILLLIAGFLILPWFVFGFVWLFMRGLPIILDPYLAFVYRTFGL